MKGFGWIILCCIDYREGRIDSPIIIYTKANKFEKSIIIPFPHLGGVNNPFLFFKKNIESHRSLVKNPLKIG
jgi:hypothetical protein